MVRNWYKIVELDTKGRVKSLFHGTDGSRILEINKWLTANIRLTKDGTIGTKYLSGWHIIPTHQECVEYLTKFKILHNKKIARCRAFQIWPKHHSRSNVYLSKNLFIEEILDE